MQTIIFDVDDTLYDQSLSFYRTVRHLISNELSDEQIAAIFKASRKHSEYLFDLSEAGKITRKEWQIGRMKRALEDFNIKITEEEAENFHNHYVKEQSNIELFPEIKELLQELKLAGYPLGILTNGEKNHQQMKIDQLQLHHWVRHDHTFISGAYGYAKPMKEIFEIVEHQLHLSSDQITYIGDSYEKDIIGAKSVGWKAIWMNHRKKAKPKGINLSPDNEVHSAKQLYELIKVEFLTD
ncbi:putative hydrolase of the HAD superfamily [Gracilibacillus halotolerans]|uniref:Putative hydrolase of the HAD superfamily n=1 Tax=Gracilibacillus halotolerans TaxID=74386 RepID=A0A841RJ00_9BACI|nr:putative hydrolase of the HAD superfamily [Gracilibacillus halotolerans]